MWMSSDPPVHPSSVTRPSMDSFLPSWFTITIFLLLFRHIPASSPTSDGDVLLQIIAKWQVSRPSNWTGDDPCQNWAGVRCENARISALNLNNQGLNGEMPSEMSKLDGLTSLDLSNTNASIGPYNSITGDLSALSSLTNLRALNLSFSYMGFEFPTVVLQLTGLTDLRIANTLMTGSFPDQLSNLKNLQYLYMANNSMTGPMPSDLGTLTNAVELSLWGITFNSTIPIELSNLSQLTYLNVHDSHLYGALPTEFENLKNMKTLYLYNNEFTGPIPESWKNMENLRDLRLNGNYLTKLFPSWILNTSLMSLDISYNYLYGPVPNISSTTLQKMNIACNFFSGVEPNGSWTEIPNCFEGHSTDDNRGKCNSFYSCSSFNKSVLTSGDCPKCPVTQLLSSSISCICLQASSGVSGSHSMSLKTSVIIGVLVGGIVAIAGASLALLIIKRCKSSNKDVEKTNTKFGELFAFKETREDWEAPKGVRMFSLEDLAKATNGFDKDHEIGVGGFGKVFYGHLEDGKEVAIKRASLSSMQGSTEFRNEVVLLSRLHHRNLVRLEGFCEDEDLQILVYEYVPNGNLHTHLFKNADTKSFGWLKRLDVAVGIAQGLDYLHSFADPPVIHRDVKPSNILLDNNMVAKVADFGISKATSEFETHISTTPAGTSGYIDPQYFLRRQLTTASDVYGFGVVLLELITGQKAIDQTREEDYNLVEWVRVKLKVQGLESIIDQRIQGSCPPHIYEGVTELALQCASFNKNDRPQMKEVLMILDGYLRAIHPPVVRSPVRMELPEVELVSSMALLLEEEDDGEGAAQDGATFQSTLAASKSAFQGAIVKPR